MLVLNEPAHLPIVNVGVPLEGFFIFAPILAIMTFIYLQFYLQNLNNMKSELEDNYAAVDKNRIYPWIVNVLDYPQPGFIGFLQKFVVRFALWWTLPTVLVIFALFYVKKHDLVMSYYLGLLPLIGTVLVVAFRHKYEKARLLDYIEKRKLGLMSVILLIIAEIIFMAYIIPWSMQGGKYDFLKPWLCVDLSYQILINEPKTDYEGIYWADFSGVHLEGANLESAVFKRADLRKSHLEEANLYKTNLFKANLESANFRKAEGFKAVLDSADLYGADLSHAEFPAASFRGAALDRANLQEADLVGANLQGAYLVRANLQGADLAYANLREVVLGSANLQEADLSGAYLQEADLTLANLHEAVLEKANLLGADIRGAMNLTIKQLSKVSTLYEAQLDSALLKQVEEQYPHLLEPPEEEEEKSSP